MQKMRGKAVVLAVFTSTTLAPSPCVSQQVRLVNVIPKLYSGESRNNPEPGVGVNPNNALIIGYTAHLLGNDLCVNPKRSGVFTSASGGNNWTLRCVLKENVGAYPGDLTIRFNGEGSWAYVSHLRPKRLHFVGTQTNLLTVKELLSGEFAKLTAADQPQVRTRPGSAEEEFGIAMIDGDHTEGSCSFARFLWADKASDPAAFTSECLDFRSLERPWAIRLTMHKDGFTYATYLRSETLEDGSSIGSVVVVRGTPSASGGTLDDLKHDVGTAECPADSKLGVIVVCGVPLPWEPGYGPDVNEVFGWEVRRGSLAIAVDPNDWKKVYVAWGDGSVMGSQLTLRVRGSSDGGATWGEDLFKITDATNPALAVDEKGRLGFLYQRFIASSRRWETHLAWTAVTGSAGNDIVLADAPAGDEQMPLASDLEGPYQGDFADLVAVRGSFFGAFSAWNDPKLMVFPSGVRYNRLCSGGELRNAFGNVVAPSIDPYFFEVQPDGAPRAVPGGNGLTC